VALLFIPTFEKMLGRILKLVMAARPLQKSWHIEASYGSEAVAEVMS
jgi:hypothetical protein